MAITLVQQKSIQAASLTLNAATTAGNTLVVVITDEHATAAPTVTAVTLGGAADNFAKAVEKVSASGIDIVSIWVDSNCAGGQTVISFTETNAIHTQIWAYEFAGQLSVDKTSSNSGSAAANWTSNATATTTKADEAWVGAVAESNTNAVPTLVVAGAWTNQSPLGGAPGMGVGAFGAVSGYQIVSSTGTATYNGTDDQSASAQNYAAAVVTLLSNAPVVTTLTATVAAADVLLSGTVNPNGLSTTYHFEYGPTTSYGTSSPGTGAGSGSSAVPVTFDVTGLPQNTTFHYRLVATNSNGTTNGLDAAFTTAGPISDVKLPLDLSAEVETASGARYTWSSKARDPHNIPQAISFNSSRGNGFADGSVTLSRRIDQDYVDINLFDTVRLIGADGSIAYEGRVAAEPRSVESTHQIQLTLAGWMAHAKDRPFTEIYADRDPNSWGDMPFNRKVQLMTGGTPISIGDITVSQDAGGLVWAFPTSSLATQVASEVWYVMPTSLTGGKVMYLGNTSSPFPAGYGMSTISSTDDAAAASPQSVGATLNGAMQTFTPSAGRRYLAFSLYSGGTAATPTAGESARISKVAVFGNHGLATHASVTSGETDGLYGSDVISNIASRFAPQLSTAGVQQTTYPIPHLVFKDLTLPFDAFTKVNGFHLWDLAVWENKTLYFRPTDTSDYDWQVRLSDRGVSVNLQGDSTDTLANGIVVQYQNLLTGQQETITPADNAALLDSNPNNPATLHGIKRWTTIQLGYATTTDAAVQIGSAALAQFNQVKAPGTISVQGHVRDRAGHWQPGWKVRSSDTIAIVDHPNSAPRLITEATWDQGSHTLRVSVDNSLSSLEAIFARVTNALETTVGTASP